MSLQMSPQDEPVRTHTPEADTDADLCETVDETPAEPDAGTGLADQAGEPSDDTEPDGIEPDETNTEETNTEEVGTDETNTEEAGTEETGSEEASTDEAGTDATQPYAPAYGTRPSADGVADDDAAGEPAEEAAAEAPVEPIACPTCEATVPAITFCEECGSRLDDEPDNSPTPVHGIAVVTGLPCPQCEETQYSDGYCNQCGGRQPQVRDHMEESPTAWVAGVCDRGVSHYRNEDSQAMVASAEPGQFAALVVCDGVSSVPRSDEASQAAAQAAVQVLNPVPDFDADETPDPDWGQMLCAAAQAGNDAVAAVAGPCADDGHNCPSCTFVSAVVDSGKITTASVGDSRAYWLPDQGTPVVLTTDDSWAQEMIRAGMPRTQAERAPQAHAITRWLGPDAPALDPAITTCQPEGPGWLCVCSDGLWNYCSEADGLRDLVVEQAAACDGDPLETARALVDWVNARGGRDNVTVVLARLASTTR
ncbi:MAG: serine/threonine-protein phosphatase [Micrococcales bacterium]|nr:serine/threonine-protein phosphatase [Micrococcales bacterium]MCL2667541.1 serine/threonine-protein phosphatase [Micrococcales bacterium]